MFGSYFDLGLYSSSSILKDRVLAETGYMHLYDFFLSYPCWRRYLANKLDIYGYARSVPKKMFAFLRQKDSLTS